MIDDTVFYIPSTGTVLYNMRCTERQAGETTVHESVRRRIEAMRQRSRSLDFARYRPVARCHTKLIHEPLPNVDSLAGGLVFMKFMSNL